MKRTWKTPICTILELGTCAFVRPIFFRFGCKTENATWILVPLVRSELGRFRCYDQSVVLRNGILQKVLFTERNNEASFPVKIQKFGSHRFFSNPNHGGTGDTIACVFFLERKSRTFVLLFCWERFDTNWAKSGRNQRMVHVLLSLGNSENYRALQIHSKGALQSPSSSSTRSIIVFASWCSVSSPINEIPCPAFWYKLAHWSYGIEQKFAIRGE